MDTENEKLIQNLIREEFRDRTVLATTHRPSTVLDFDMMVTIEDGRIDRVGLPDELV